MPMQMKAKTQVVRICSRLFTATLPVIARANAIPYDIICHMLDDGMLSEATFSGSDNAVENKKLAQDNLPFIVDYYYHNNRTK